MHRTRRFQRFRRVNEPRIAELTVYELLFARQGRFVTVTFYERQIRVNLPIGEDSDLFVSNESDFATKLAEVERNIIGSDSRTDSIWFLELPGSYIYHHLEGFRDRLSLSPTS